MERETVLKTGWRFTLDEVPSYAYYKGLDDGHWREVEIPHDWSVEYPFDQKYSSGTGYLRGGEGWYRCRFTLPAEAVGRHVEIHFGGVYKNAKVWINSTYLGRRPSGYTSFSYNISDYICEGENVVAVHCEHRDLADSRWFTGNGIYREVTLTVTEKCHFEDVFVYTKEVGENQAAMGLEYRTSLPGKVSFRVLFKGAEVESSFGDGILTIPNPKLWDCETPNLYTLVSTVMVDGVVQDETKTTFGIRTFSFDQDTGFTLNGKSMKLKGLCMHHDAGVLGAAVPKAVWRSRFETFRAGGCNAIRCSHNPPDPKFLDLCDEMGFLVMDEAFDEWEGCKNKWWQGHNVYPPKHNGYYEDFPEWHERDLRDLIIRDRNHPSIILWSIGNEIDYPNDPYVHPYFDTMTGNNDANKPEAERQYDRNKPNADRLAVIAAELVRIAKDTDSTRPITSALAFPELSNLTGYAQALDVVGYNYKEHLYLEDHNKYPNHVIYGSENSTDAPQWLPVKQNDYICGQFLWTGIDFLGEAHGWPIRVSQAGLLTLAGHEKPNYYRRKMLWTEEPATKLTTGLVNSVWEERFLWNYQEGATVFVSCYTNCEKAELFVNGKSAGEKTLTEADLCRATWEIPFVVGEVTVKCGRSGETLATDTLKTCGEAAALVLTPVGYGEVLQFDLSLVDKEGVAVTNQDEPVTVTLAGGKLMGVENGNPADLTPYPEHTRKTYRGRARIYLKKTAEVATLLIQRGGLTVKKEI